MAGDRYKYFRVEARELLEGLTQGVLAAEKSGAEAELIGRILRLAHTLKGAARVVKQVEAAELAHSLEEVFAAYRESSGIVPKNSIEQALQLLDAISKRLNLLDHPVPETTEHSPRRIEEHSIETVRVDVAEVGELIAGVSEARVQITGLQRETASFVHLQQLAEGLLSEAALARPAAMNGNGSQRSNIASKALAEELRAGIARLEQSLNTGIEQLRAELAQIGEAANRLRLLPAATLFGALERSIRDAAGALNKKVLFAGTGGENRLDAHVLAPIRDALLHIVRNAVAHGIESQAERARAGKPEKGRIELRIERRGSRIVFTCQDDGQGIDVAAIREVAVRRGLVAPAQAASLGFEDAVRIIFGGGISTAHAVDEVSGRGIGLDVVRETVSRLKGEVSIASERGKGTTVEMSVPVSLSSLVALEVEANGTVAFLPVEAVRQVLQIAAHDVARSAGTESILYDGSAVPFLHLSEVFGDQSLSDRQRHVWPAIIVGSATGTAAIAVERLYGIGSVVMRSLPQLAKVDPVVAGASFDTEGNPQPILDPNHLVAKARVARSARVQESAQKIPSVLVIDDSLTTRMLEQNILESAGYQVDLAVSGEEGLAKAREKRFDLFLVDVEMPGIDGFEFITRTQRDQHLRRIPSILVTSRNAPEDRRRGEQAGAKGYVVKGEFDQARLLQMIEGLLPGMENAEDARIGG